MPMTMTGSVDRVEVITSVQRRRRWSAEEKARIVQETPAFARAGSMHRGCRCRWWRASTGSRRTRYSNGDSSTPRARYQRWGLAKRLSRPPTIGRCSSRCANCSGYWAKRPRERDPARSARSDTAKKTAVAVALACSRGHPVKRIARALGVARSNLVTQAKPSAVRQRRGRRPQPEDALLAEIKP